MTTYFTAPDGHGEPTLWFETGLILPQPILRKVDLGPGMDHHWDELVARVIAGNPDAQQMSWREALRNPQDHDIEWGTPVDRRLAHIQGQYDPHAVIHSPPTWFCADCQEFQPQSHEHWPHGLDNT